MPSTKKPRITSSNFTRRRIISPIRIFHHPRPWLRASYKKKISIRLLRQNSEEVFNKFLWPESTPHQDQPRPWDLIQTSTVDLNKKMTAGMNLIQLKWSTPKGKPSTKTTRISTIQLSINRHIRDCMSNIKDGLPPRSLPLSGFNGKKEREARNLRAKGSDNHWPQGSLSVEELSIGKQEG